MSKKFFIIGQNLQSSICLNGASNLNTIDKRLTEFGWKSTENCQKADAIIGSLCVMTSEEIKEAVQLVKQYSSFSAPMYICGCITKVPEIIVPLQTRFKVSAFSTPEELICHLTNTKVSAKKTFEIINNQFVINISAGCNKRCTFCKTNYMEATYHSKPIQDIINAINDGISLGFNFIVLNAMNSTEYGCDFEVPTTLNTLLKKCLEIPNVVYQINGLVASELTPELIETLSDPRFIIVQLETQSFIANVRKNMGIGDEHSKILKNALRSFKSKVIFSNIMIGYPGESNKKFEEELNLIKRENFWFLTVNALEATPGTPVMYMDRPETSNVKKRIQKLEDVIYDLRIAKSRSLLNKTVRVLVVSKVNDLFVGVYQGIFVYIHNFDSSIKIGDEYDVVLRSVISHFNIQQQIEMSDQPQKITTNNDKPTSTAWINGLPKEFQNRARSIVAQDKEDPFKTLMQLNDLMADILAPHFSLSSSVPEYLNLKDFVVSLI